MPRYDFVCSNNHKTEIVLSFKEFEELKRVNDIPVMMCMCEEPAFKEFSPPGISMNYKNGMRH